MSSSRQNGSGTNQNGRPRSRSNRDGTPPWPRLPPMRTLPPLRGISTPQDHDDESPSASATGPSSRLGAPQRPPYMSPTAALRAERIRNLQAFVDRATAAAEVPDRPFGWTVHRNWQRADSDRAGPPPPLDEHDHAVEGLEEANSRLRALLDSTYSSPDLPRINNRDSATINPSTMHVTFSPSAFRPNELPDDSNRRNKRRKIDAERQDSNFKGFRYGKYGQLEPGQLQMEIVSCDGGMFSNRQTYSADNILKDDNSVYCTKGNRCNIVLRHQGATAFTLQELVIKAPASMNFSHPVREGMVFVAMEQDDALSRTAQYQVQYTHDTNTSHAASCPYAPNNNNDDHENHRPLSRNELDNELRRVITIRRARDSASPLPESALTQRWDNPYLLDFDDDDDEEEPISSSAFTIPTHRRPHHSGPHWRQPGSSSARRRHPSMPSEFSSNHPDFQITTECSDDEEDPNPLASRRPRPPPPRIGSLPFEAADSDSEDYGDMPALLGRVANDNEGAPSDSLLQAWEAHARATQEAVRAVGGGKLLVPHARFFIEKRKSKCTIRFDPPVSGRFILLKMWSSHHESGGNIDIQGVVARGFAGPRYFPSVELR